jgi:hypothetical protein
MNTFPWLTRIKADPIPWLLEPDPNTPGVRYFTLVDLLSQPSGSAEAREARAEIMRSGPVPAILAAQAEEGYWVNPGPGYWPKYQGTVWSVIFLAQFGAEGSDPRVKRGGEYTLEHNRCPYGGLSIDGSNAGMIHCLQGNLAAALIDLGWLGDARLQRSLSWLAQSITGDGIAPAEEKDAPLRYYRGGNSGPGFACAANNYLPCAWGAVKAALALSRVPPEMRTNTVNRAVERAKDFLLGGKPVEADYPRWAGGKPSRSWFQFGYPIGYVTDVLQNLEALAALGCAADPRVTAGMEYVLSKQDEQGRWRMEYTYNGKTWADVEEKGRPSKWITLRALRLVKKVWAEQ